MYLQPWAGFWPCCISHSGKVKAAPINRPQWWRVLSDSEQSWVWSGMDYLLPALLPRFCLLLSVFLLSLLLPLRGLHPISVQRSPSPMLPKLVPPYNGFGSEKDWCASKLGAQMPQETFVQIFGEYQVGGFLVNVSVRWHIKVLVSECSCWC